MHRHAALACMLLGSLMTLDAAAQTGVDDDRVSLPEGPGSLEGVGDNVAIDPNMGSMSYAVPILVPEGRRGQAPAIGLTYSSSGQAGLVGVGWSVPMPSIGRLTSRGVPAYGTDDVFVVDGGDELVQTATNGQDQVYRARFEKSFQRHTWVKAGDVNDYWLVETPDGTRNFYGASQDGTTVSSARLTDGGSRVAEYQLVESVDPFGNRILYEYNAQGSNKPLLSRISYVFVGDTPTYTIDYTYEDRPDPISDANVGFEVVLNKRLTGITTRFEDQIIREYVLAYETEMASGGLSRLATVTQWGLGGVAGGVENPIRFSFEYQKGLGVDCTEANCDKPYLVSMGSVGVALSSGRATLIDINGDALPDVLDSSQNGNHRFLLNTLTAMPDGSFTQSFSAPVASTIDASSSFLLGDNVQTLDVNGDGYADLVNTDTGAFLLKDPARDDWRDPGSSINVGPLPSIDFANAKFFDYDNDKRIDVLVSSGSLTQVIANDGQAFATVGGGIDTLGVNFSDESVELSDINGDGMTDPVSVVPGTGALQYRVNLGRGKFSEWRELTGVSIAGAERDLYDLEDLNGDGRDDIVVVTSGEVKYALNRGDRFDPYVTITDVDGALPDRPATTSVLYADMNANGSEDIVWFDDSGSVTFLELFPQRPNLLSRTDNGIGFVQKITYGTAAEQASLAARDGAPWTNTLQIPMAVVQEVDNYVLLTGDDDGSGLHDVVSYRYRDAFYDGVEKQYRGFEDVTTTMQASESQEGGRLEQTFDVGRTDPARNGLTLETVTFSGDRELRVDTSTFETCPLDDSVPDAAALSALGRRAVTFVCQTAKQGVVKEGAADMAAWLTERTTYQYDAYGNVTRTSDEGIVSVDGDELNTQVTYAAPESVWFLRLPLTEQRWVRDGGRRAETTYYYDGEDYVGAQTGITHGFLSRMTVKADDTTTLETLRQTRDAFGNIATLLDPRATAGDRDDFLRLYEYDAYGLFITSSRLRNLDPEGGSYELVRASRHDYRFQKPSSADDWVVVRDGTELTPTNTTTVTYDDLGRVATRSVPTDDLGEPSFESTYELGPRFSKVTQRIRAVSGATADRELVTCLDGRGRDYQTRVKISQSRWLVSGFTSYNSRGAEVSVFQPYESTTGDCESTEPEGIGVYRTSYDALFRPLEKTRPDADIYGQASVERWSYEPFLEVYSDVEDTDMAGPHAGTPLLRRRDGLGRVVEMQRTWTESSALQTASYELLYDDVGAFAGYVDPKGNRHEMTVDLAGRVTQVTNANFGTLSMAYDVAGNLTSKTDGRGVALEQVFDNLGRIVERVDPARPDASRMTWRYDLLGDCDPANCTQPASRLVAIDFQHAEGMAGAQHFGYDVRGRPTYVEQSYGDLALAMRVEYNNFGDTTSVQHPDGTRVAMSYDGASRVVGVDDFLTSLTYAPQGQLVGIDYANGAASTLTYDAMLRAQTLKHVDAGGGVIDSYELSRDRMGNLTSITDVSERQDIPNAGGSLGYDDWYRLVEANTTHEDGSAETLTYNYDELDNVLSLTSSLGDASRAHVGDMMVSATAPNQVTQAGAIAYAYDAAGQVTSRGGAMLAWDHQGRMTSFGDAQYLYGSDELQTATLTDDGMTLYFTDEFEIRDGVSYTYVRVEGNRLARQQSTAAMTSIYPDLTGDDAITAADAFALEQAGSAEVPFAPAATTERVLGAAAARMLADAEDDRAFLHVDYLGSVVAATDDGGAVRGHRAYYPTGKVRWESGYVDRYGFTGQEHMESGLIRFQFRHLDPVSARWTSFDPAFQVLDAAQMERLGEATTGYAYVANNFANITDPLGLMGDDGSDEPGRPGESGNYDIDQDFEEEGDEDPDYWEEDDDDGEVTPGGVFDGWDQDVVDNFVGNQNGPTPGGETTSGQGEPNDYDDILDEESPWDENNPILDRFENILADSDNDWGESPVNRQEPPRERSDSYENREFDRSVSKFTYIVFLSMLAAVGGVLAGTL